MEVYRSSDLHPILCTGYRHGRVASTFKSQWPCYRNVETMATMSAYIVCVLLSVPICIQLSKHRYYAGTLRC
ncbi:hypothetical protein O9993_23445 [Vibrio lentus]|nr:hypothetical protein [Vibrio lentus]